MEKTSDLLWRAWSQKFCEIVEAMDHRFTDRDGSERYINHYFHKQPNGELLQLITTGRSDDVIDLNLYGAGGSSTIVASLEVRSNGEIRIGTGNAYHRLEEGTAPELVDFLKRMRAKAVSQVPPSPRPAA
ncbi:hypothetical protein [Rhizobium sp. BK176]|uniref:hypothetical protein n=1 Tax=Rhizobium sp. BK176 TaxID=2587071 RepID=UPI0021677C83|nr:hypothetical protein [Rhizobium sp. BK176]MCS4089377.1 hypothetical protein [Rhizobium sp. BK176]